MKVLLGQTSKEICAKEMEVAGPAEGQGHEPGMCKEGGLSLSEKKQTRVWGMVKTSGRRGSRNSYWGKNMGSSTGRGRGKG